MVNTPLIAVIPARGGSKRIPKKNIIEFGGKPLIAWTIEAALEAEVFDRVLVSTDDPEIAEIANSCGADTPFLRDKAADDISVVSDATIAALSQAGDHWREEYGTVVQLMANCPLRDAADIRDAVKAFDENQANFQISCFPYGWNNPWWAVKLADDGQPIRLFPEAYKKRSQDLETLYCPTGAIWLAKADKLVEAGTFYGPDVVFHPLSWLSAMDIDDYEDLNMARALLSVKSQELQEK